MSCAATACHEFIVKGQIFCADHWEMLPRHYQRSIQQSWYSRAIQDHLTSVAEAVELIEAYEGRYTDIFGNKITPRVAPWACDAKALRVAGASHIFTQLPHLGKAI